MEPDPLSLFVLPDLLLVATSLVVTLPLILVLLALSGIVSGSEVAFFSLTPNDYEQLEQEETVSGNLLLAIRERPRILLATILIANNFINIAIVLVSELLVRDLLSEALLLDWATGLLASIPMLGDITGPLALASFISFAITVVGVTFLLVLFGEVAPKVYARYNHLKLALTMARPIRFLMGAFYFLSSVLVNGASFIERRLDTGRLDAGTSQEDIDEAIEMTMSSEEGEGGPDQRQDVDLLKRIVQFNSVTVRQIMRSRQDVTAVDQKIAYPELLTLIRESSYSRIPVFEEDFDQLVGILYVKDLLGHRHEPADFAWQNLVRRENLFVPENKKISDLLKQFQQQKMHMAVVVDEYGGSKGIVTLEDILEEVIGDIHDEFDGSDEVIYQRVDDLNYVFDGKTLLNDACRIVKIPTSTFDNVKGEAESLAGLILEMLGQFPEEEQEIECGDYRFKVMAMNKRRVEEILITLPEPAEETPRN